jgi:VWFA-related protein
MTRFLAGSGVALGVCIAVLCAQTQSQPARASDPQAGDDVPIQVNVNVVNVLASVRDKHNALIPNLAKDDFELFEDGKAQTIKYFTRETNLPLTIGLLVDVSASQEHLIEIEKRAASVFLQQVMRPKDEAFIISFGADSELLQDLTNSHSALAKGLDQLRPNFGFQGINAGPVPTAISPHGTVLFDAVYLAASDRLAHEVGRKAIVVITDGVDQGSKLNIKKAIEYAQKSDAAIYGIYYVDRGFYSQGGFMLGGGGEGWGVLKQMSNETGGHAYEVTRKDTLDKIFDQLQEEMRTQYAIAYTPTNSTRDGSYRKLDVRTKNRDYKVQARKGYYALPDEK